MFLLDINVWLALAFGTHAHHASAKRWFDGLRVGERCFFCRLTQQGFLRLANNSHAFPQFAVSQDRAWLMYDALLGDSCVDFAPELLELEKHWRPLTQLSSHSPKVWADAYLAAFAIASDWELVTFDKGFHQYKGLRLTTLS